MLSIYFSRYEDLNKVWTIELFCLYGYWSGFNLIEKYDPYSMNWIYEILNQIDAYNKSK